MQVLREGKERLLNPQRSFHAAIFVAIACSIQYRYAEYTGTLAAMHHEGGLQCQETRRSWQAVRCVMILDVISAARVVVYQPLMAGMNGMEDLSFFV